MVAEKVVTAVREYLRELESNGLRISKAFVYGSQANGTATADSDIDLMLISPLFDSEYKEYLRAIWFSDIRVDNRIEPFAVGEERFATDDISPIIGIVKKEGVEIEG